MKNNMPYVLIRGGGDLASGVAIRLHRSGFRVLITELPEPLVIRRTVSFAEAVFSDKVIVEDVTAIKVDALSQIEQAWQETRIPVLVDQDAAILNNLPAVVVVDARMKKTESRWLSGYDKCQMVIGLGPGFAVGKNCTTAIETKRGHFLGRVYWEGTPEADTGVPGSVKNKDVDRVLRSPADGIMEAFVSIGDVVKEGQLLLRVGQAELLAPFSGVVRGLLYDGLLVHTNMKIGDLDPRGDREYCYFVSDKALAIGGAVLEAILSYGKAPILLS